MLTNLGREEHRSFHFDNRCGVLNLFLHFKPKFVPRLGNFDCRVLDLHGGNFLLKFFALFVDKFKSVSDLQITFCDLDNSNLNFVKIMGYLADGYVSYFRFTSLSEISLFI